MRDLVAAIREPQDYRGKGIRPPKGIVMYGPPGNGKTLIAAALAKEADADFITVKVPDIADKWYGNSEKRVGELFAQARKRGGRPTILFFDEMDGLFRDRSKTSSEASTSVLSTILSFMDGIQPMERIFVIGATNLPDTLDGALMRPGRIDRKLEVPKPDEPSRSEILAVAMKKHEGTAGRPLFENIDFKALAASSSGFSGAELAEAVRRSLEAQITAGRPDSELVTQAALKRMLLEVKTESERTKNASSSSNPTGMYL